MYQLTVTPMPRPRTPQRRPPGTFFPPAPHLAEVEAYLAHVRQLQPLARQRFAGIERFSDTDLDMFRMTCFLDDADSERLSLWYALGPLRAQQQLAALLDYLTVG